MQGPDAIRFVAVEPPGHSFDDDPTDIRRLGGLAPSAAVSQIRPELALSSRGFGSRAYRTCVSIFLLFVPRVLSFFSGGFAQASCLFDFEFVHHGPEEAHEFASDRDRGDGGWSPASDAVEELVEMVLSLPGMCHDLGWLSVLSRLELLA